MKLTREQRHRIYTSALLAFDRGELATGLCSLFRDVGAGSAAYRGALSEFVAGPVAGPVVQVHVRPPLLPGRPGQRGPEAVPAEVHRGVGAEEEGEKRQEEGMTINELAHDRLP